MIKRILANGSLAVTTREMAVETPVSISVNGIGYAVMMATPADLDDFALGFAFCERLISRPEQLLEVRLHQAEHGTLLDLMLAPACIDAVRERVRHRVADSGCGLCGIDNLEAALRPLPLLNAPPVANAAAVFAAGAALSAYQPLNRACGAVHAAAFADAQGRISLAREDVGRHNALDKLIGAMLAAGIDSQLGFILLSSRCSYELVEKTALLGCPMLVTISAPTTLAIARAADANLTLIALARADSMLVMTDPHGIFPG